MPFIRGGNATLVLVKPGTPTTQTLTTQVNNLSISFDSGLTEVTSLSDTYRDFQETILSGTITVSGFFDDSSVGTTAGADYFLGDAINNDSLLNWSIVLGTTTTRTYRNSGYSTSSPSTSHGARIASYEQSNDVGGIAAFSMTLNIHGTWEVV
jgi:hypothetical protein